MRGVPPCRRNAFPNRGAEQGTAPQWCAVTEGNEHAEPGDRYGDRERQGGQAGIIADRRPGRYASSATKCVVQTPEPNTTPATADNKASFPRWGRFPGTDEQVDGRETRKNANGCGQNYQPEIMLRC